MVDLLNQGAAWLEEQRHKYLTQAVVYQRGEATVEVLATVGRTEFDLNDSAGGSVRSVSRDFLIRTQDLVLEGQATLPQRGDRISETTADGTVYVHEVLGPGSEPAWRYSDPGRRTLRVHTKQIDQEAGT